MAAIHASIHRLHTCSGLSCAIHSLSVFWTLGADMSELLLDEDDEDDEKRPKKETERVTAGARRRRGVARGTARKEEVA